jgi:nucleotide-binding universal stress UspA family protein
MSATWTRGVVVGIDGSAESMHAFDWALAAADRHDVPLRAVHAQAVPVGPIAPVPAYDAEALDAEAETILRHALERVGARPDGAEKVEATVRVGQPASVLVELSRDADLVVVGRRGAGGRHQRLGSVSSATAARAHRPVAVVPAASRGTVPDRVVVGVDLDDDPTAALEVAFGEAKRSGCAVELVHVIEPPTEAARDAGLADPLEVRGELRAVLDRWAGRFVGVHTDAQARAGDPETVLLDHVTPSDLLVLGGRRHPHVVGRLLGSVPDALIVAAPCVVVVAHTHRRGAE